MTFQYSFKDLLQRAERITWRVEDRIGGDKKLDFARPFLPESFTRAGELEFLTADEKLALSQIRGNTDLAMFGIIEEFILPFVLDHARPFLNGEDYRARAFLEFASEEAKHIHLFRRFAEEFRAGFGVSCAVIGPPEAISAHVLAQPPLAVALLTLQIEWMTQRHFQESVSDDTSLDPQFKSLLLHHWMEEHQHAQLDTFMTLAIAEGMSRAEIDAAFDAYFALGAVFDEGLKQQTAFDLDALERAVGRSLGALERERFLALQHQANRWTYLGSGMTHPRFLETVGELSADRRAAIEAAAPGFC